MGEIGDVPAASRCLSSDRLAMAALRAQTSCMAAGLAVGAAADLAVDRGIALRQVDVVGLKSRSRRRVAIAP